MLAEKITKKTLSILLASTLVFTLVPSTALARELEAPRPQTSTEVKDRNDVQEKTDEKDLDQADKKDQEKAEEKDQNQTDEKEQEQKEPEKDYDLIKKLSWSVQPDSAAPYTWLSEQADQYDVGVWKGIFPLLNRLNKSSFSDSAPNGYLTISKIDEILKSKPADMTVRDFIWYTLDTWMPSGARYLVGEYHGKWTVNRWSRDEIVVTISYIDMNEKNPTWHKGVVAFEAKLATDFSVPRGKLNNAAFTKWRSEVKEYIDHWKLLAFLDFNQLDDSGELRLK